MNSDRFFSILFINMHTLQDRIIEFYCVIYNPCSGIDITDLCYDEFSVIFEYINCAKTIANFKRLSKSCKDIVCNTRIPHQLCHKEFIFTIENGAFNIEAINYFCKTDTECHDEMDINSVIKYKELFNIDIKITKFDLIHAEKNIYGLSFADIVEVFIDGECYSDLIQNCLDLIDGIILLDFGYNMDKLLWFLRVFDESSDRVYIKESCISDKIYDIQWYEIDGEECYSAVDLYHHYMLQN